MSLPAYIVIGFLCGILFGGLVVYLLLKYRAGGRSAGELKKELDTYREQVESHFDKTSELFAATTEQYRTLYEHLSKESLNLTGKDSVAVALESMQGILPGQMMEDRIEDQREPGVAQEPGTESEEGDEGDNQPPQLTGSGGGSQITEPEGESFPPEPAQKENGQRNDMTDKSPD